ncbi:MAG: hypothetical protein WBX25_12960 [Rhodomicrobium sp.]
MPYDRSWKRRYFSFVVLWLFVETGTAFAASPFLNGFPAAEDFFPIGVWLQSPARAPVYKSIGINTFVGLWQGPTEEQLKALAQQGMFAVAMQNEVGLKSPFNHVIKGWIDADEPDNAQPIGLGLFGTCIPAAKVSQRFLEMKANDGTRPVMVTFGEGIANESWYGRGPCTGDQGYYATASKSADVLGFDIYPVGTPVREVKGKLEYVARGVSKLEQLAGANKKVWNAVEASVLDPKRPLRPQELRAEVWMSLIHGSSGIVYFVHELSPFREDAIFAHPELVSEVARTNKLIRELAPVLNSPSLTSEVTITAAVPIAVMAKRKNGALYVFAVSMRNEGTAAHFQFSSIRDGNAEVIGESQTVAVRAGAMDDRFEGYTVHIYRIALDSNG